MTQPSQAAQAAWDRMIRDRDARIEALEKIRDAAQEEVAALEARIEALERELPMDVVALSVPVTIGFVPPQEEP